MKNILLSFSMLCLMSSIYAQIDHSVWDKLLRKHVTNSGKVDYRSFRSDTAALHLYLKQMKSTVVAETATVNDKKAYWCNLYNAQTVLLVIENYPIRSVNEIKLGGSTPRTRKYIRVGEEVLSLSEIEYKKLMNEFKDSRIHFVLNSGSISSPVLLNKAYTAENIEGLLTEQTARFINDNSRNEIGKKTVRLSSLFEWYAYELGDVKAFVNAYSKKKISKKAVIEYLPYSWDLNE